MTISRKYAPYILIGFICIIGSLVRAIILAEFPWFFHLFGFLAQFGVLSALWQLVGFINRLLEKKFSFEKRPGTQIFLQVLVTLVVISPVFIGSFILARPYIMDLLGTRIAAFMLAILVLVIMLITFGYYTFELFQKNREASEEKVRLQLQAAELEKEKSMMQYHHLRNQVNPHFLFNTFSSLDGLIQSDPQLASEFVKHLSKVYRYVLEHKENVVVTVNSELDFINHYISLLSIRYQSAIDIQINFSESGREKGIVMVTLQMLIDNALKHNAAHPGSPLKLNVWDEDGYFHVRNNKQLRKQIESSSRQGLYQLIQLYSFHTERPVMISENEGYFEVKIPLL